MIRPRHLTVTAVAALFATLAGCASSSHKAVTTDKLEPYQCGTVQRLHTYQGVFLASQPQPADFEQAKAGGVKTVINLRHDDEIKDFEEEFVGKSLGLEYHNVPISGPRSTEESRTSRADALLVLEPSRCHVARLPRTGRRTHFGRSKSGSKNRRPQVARTRGQGCRLCPAETRNVAMTTTETIRVMIVDDHPIVRHGMAALIDCEDDLQVCGQAGDASQAMELVQRLRPHVAIVDVSLADGDDGLDLIKRIRDLDLGVAVLVVSIHDPETHAQRALQAGARGYMNKGHATAHIVDAIRRVHAGEQFIGPGEPAPSHWFG